MLTILMAGCAFLHLKEEEAFTQQSVVLVGSVSSTLSPQEMPVVVVAYSKNGDAITIDHYTTLHEQGPYELLVTIGAHNIVAFGDLNRNLVYDRGEPAGQLINAEQGAVPAGGVVGNLDIVMTEHDGNEIDFPVGSRLPPKEYDSFHSTAPGAIANIDDPLFSAEYGKKGFWAPMEFFREIGGNVYFLEKYDPAKIPILFVHGASGSPRDWRTFFESIDRSRYQPWFFYYPSGSSIDSMAYLLLWKMQNLQTKYKFDELYITAHSMGGLVVRSFIVNYGRYFPTLSTFISISTPWGGEELAELGVKYSPAVIPAWHDMQPHSPFINSLFMKSMPESIDHYLFFGHKGNRNILRPNNDKAVTLTSQLDYRSQKDAKMIYGFNEDHVGILSSPLVLSQYNAILANIDRRSNDADKKSGNRLQVDYSFDFPEDSPRPRLYLLLQPTDSKGAETLVHLGPDDSGKVHGPFLPGKYNVTLLAPAFSPQPSSIPIRIDDDQLANVTFELEPVGYIRGYVIKSEPGIQTGTDWKPDPDVPIESITLKGNGILRTVRILPGEEGSYDEYFAEHYLTGTDFTSGGAFFFFGLPAGEYELSITAKGYQPYSQVCIVR
ncbi:MAG: hypothetical protein C0623_05270, partial [Desulfuromonas sp.]